MGVLCRKLLTPYNLALSITLLIFFHFSVFLTLLNSYYPFLTIFSYHSFLLFFLTILSYCFFLLFFLTVFSYHLF